MSLGVLNNIAALYATNSLNQTQQSLQTTLQQLSSGSRINSGADDAAGLAVANGLGANVAALTQSGQNATQGVGLLQTADGALSQVTTLLNRAVTLATESSNGTLNSNQVSSANQEYQNILSEIANIGSTTNYNGNNVFSSTATTFLVSDGTSSGANVFSDTIGTLTTNSIGQTAPLTSPVTSNFATPSPNAPHAAVTTPTPSTGTVTFGGSAAASGDSSTGSISVTIDGHTYTSGSATTLAAVAANLNTALTTGFGGVAAGSASITNGVLTINGASDGSNSITGANITSTIQDTSVTAQHSGGSTTNSFTGGTPVSPATGGTAVFTPTNLTDTFSGTLSASVAGGTPVSITVKAGTTASQLASLINSTASFQAAHLSATYNSTNGAVTLAAAAGNTNTLSLTGTSLQATTVPPPGPGIDFTNASIATLTGGTTGTAQTVLTSVTSAIADVAYQRGTIGANINQLNAAANVAASEATNLTSAQSNITSTNYGEASSNLAKYEVLSQTGIAALAQANTVQQEVLKLLQ